MTTVSQEAREAEVTQADREAALPILCHLYVRKGEEPALFIAEVKAGKYDDHYQIQALARHRHQAERETLARMEWRGIESAPKACHVLAARFNEDCGEWQMQVTLSPPIYPFTHWMPLPPAPEAGQ